MAPNVQVTVYCNECEDQHSEKQEMTGGTEMWENEGARTHARVYTCPVCKGEVTVILRAVAS